jgi:hypothetical protein
MELEEQVELGRKIEARTGRSSVVAVRVSADLLGRVSDYARENGMTISEAFREGVSRLVVDPHVASRIQATGLRIIHGHVDFDVRAGTTGVSREWRASEDSTVSGSLTASV